jgi:hypothetical protein
MPGYLAGHFVLDSSETISTIIQEFDRFNKRTGLVFFVFCPKNSKYYEQLASNADFWNRYSDKYVTILIPGYIGYLSRPFEHFNDIVPTEFSFDHFKQVYEKFEEVTTWKYSGGTDIIGVMVTNHNGELGFDYKNAVVTNIDSIDTDGKFDLSGFIVGLINASKGSPQHPLSEIGKKNAVYFIVTTVRLALPQKLREMLDVAPRFILHRDISRPT